MMDFIKKYYIQLSIIAGFVILAVFVLLQSRSIMVMIGEQSLELKEIQLDRIIAADFLQSVHIFKRNSEHIDENIETFNVLMPDNDESKVRLFSELEKTAQETGNGEIVLAISKVSSGGKKKKKKDAAEDSVQEMLGIKITITGSYDNLVHFIEKIENMKYYSKITSINIVKTKGAPHKKIERHDDGTTTETVIERKNLLRTEMGINFYLNGE